ncbi:MAG TPA: M6 family metalloprotease domain-containing protein [Candidatus Cloacimonas sp.]|nr:M6 family metalloprotease domain-containing protein [Candidatus Cloacimonadota bacterium]HNZ33451.1 M6 family metalloprotease domain-containing protein [Candidatus Cloacimonas sp.]MDD3734138.1 M6 family metalloprotease domain-containing protein [Candidatus Cloacimonadota bacterium]MDD3869803.1 M6 family metalloprotease domain-containing protein [Candidatus Cloacimonadota bacterium]MDD4676715.1 M6 family metalloprotease domain-containing protein [Candidatus Cloacimonadota bacterium]
MKKCTCLLLCVIPILGFAAPFYNIPSQAIQPDGSVLNLYASGDEYSNRLHDANGFTIIQSPDDGYYYYAILENGEPVPSAYRFGTIDPASYGITPNINISKGARQRKINFMNAHKRGNERGPSTGVVNNLCVYIRFSDQTEFEIPRTVYDARFNEVGDDARSLRSYFQKASYNQLHYMTYHYPVCPDIFNLSYQDSHPRSYYLPYNYITNPGGYHNEDERCIREQTLLMNAINSIASQVPSSLNIDADNNGTVDNVCFIIRGPHSAWADLLWAHRWSLFYTSAYINNKEVYDFTFQPEDQNDVTTLCHEMFHSVGAPDLYHYEYDGLTPVGCWDLMESGDGHMGMYMKYAYGGWIPSIPLAQIGNTYTLNPVTSAENNVYKYPIPGSSNQFLIFEYRKKSSDIFEENLPNSGLLIYRIDQTMDGNVEGPPDGVYVYRPDGSLTNNGLVAEAPFSANNFRTAFNEYTNPSSFLNNGSTFPVNITNITEAGETISFTIFSPAVTMAPVIDAIHPANGSILADNTLNIYLQVTDPAEAIQRVEYTLDGILVYTATAEPYTGIISDYLLTPGVHNIGITAFSASNLSTTVNINYRIVNPDLENWFSWLSSEPHWIEYGRGAIPIKAAIDMDLGNQEYIVKALRFNITPDPWGEPDMPGMVYARINRFSNGAITDQLLLDIGYCYNFDYDPNFTFNVVDTTHISGQIAVILDLYEYQNMRFDRNAACGHSWIYEPNRPWTDALGRGIVGAAAIELLLQNPNVSIEEPNCPALNISLSSYPNPFTSTTKIKYSLPASGKVNLTIYNLKGQKVKNLLTENKTVGNYEMEWNGTDTQGKNVGSGLYLCRLVSGNRTATTKLLRLSD